jgi:hypothetical protein
MTKLLYWLVYNVDLGPLGPALLGLSVRTWLGMHRSRQMRADVVRRLRIDADTATTLAWTPR